MVGPLPWDPSDVVLGNFRVVSESGRRHLDMLVEDISSLPQFDDGRGLLQGIAGRFAMLFILAGCEGTCECDVCYAKTRSANFGMIVLRA